MKAWVRTFLRAVVFVPAKVFRLVAGIVPTRAFGLVLVGVLVLCFFFVWPGVYRYEYKHSAYTGTGYWDQSRRYENVIRIDRLTGNVQKLSKGNPGREHWVNHHP